MRVRAPRPPRGIYSPVSRDFPSFAERMLIVRTTFSGLILTLMLSGCATGRVGSEIGRYTSDANGFDTHSYFYDTGKEVVVFDAQFTPSEAENVVSAIRAQTKQPDPLPGRDAPESGQVQRRVGVSTRGREGRGQRGHFRRDRRGPRVQEVLLRQPREDVHGGDLPGRSPRRHHLQGSPFTAARGRRGGDADRVEAPGCRRDPDGRAHPRSQGAHRRRPRPPQGARVARGRAP